MGMVVQHNMNALNAYNKLNTNVAGLKKSSEKLSSGYRINRAGDDAAGLAISEKMRSQIRGLNQAKRNAQDGISMIQTFEGALQETHSILQRMKELAAESANGTYQTEVDRDAIQLEFDQLNDELNQIADTDFNGTVALNGGVMADGAKANSKGLIDYNDQTRSATDIGSSSLFGTVDDSMYNKAAADELWTQTGTSGKQDTLEIKFTFDGTDWTADAKGLDITATDNGGFTVEANGVTVANVLFDQSDKVAGDTITLKFTGGDAKVQAPTNIGIKNDTFDEEAKAKINVPTSALAIAAADIDENAGKALAALEAGVSITGTTGANGAVPADATGISVDGGAIGTTYTKIGDANSTLYAKYESGVLTFASIKDGKTDASVDANMTVIGTTTFTANTTDKPAATALDFTLQVDKPKYNGVDSYNVDVVKSSANVSVSDAFQQSTAKLTYTNEIVLQVGARTKDAVNFTFSYDSKGMGDLQANINVSSRKEGLDTASLSLNTQESANAAIDKIDNAINKVSMVRATFGSVQNRLEHKIENLTTTSENLTEAESGIRDTDMASEMLNYTKFNVLQQAAQSMLAQANQQPQSILQLLG